MTDAWALRGESHSALAVDPRATHRTVRAVSLDALVGSHAGGASVDVVKVDLEGAEASILTRNTDWASRVRAISVEVHPPSRSERAQPERPGAGKAAAAGAAQSWHRPLRR
jgi:hypothetical protein